METKIIQKLTTEEANAIDEITRVYKLPFSIFTEEDDNCIEGSDYIYDNEVNESLSLFDGVSQILEAIRCDNGELYYNDEIISENERAIFFELCVDLEIINENDVLIY